MSFAPIFGGFGSGGSGGGGATGWTILVDHDLGATPQATFESNVSGYNDVEVLLTRVNNVGDDSIGIFVSNDGSTYESSNIWRWTGGGRNAQTSVVAKYFYAGVVVSRTIIENLNDADSGIHWYSWHGDFENSYEEWGGQATPSAIQKIKVESVDLSNMDSGHIIVRAR